MQVTYFLAGKAVALLVFKGLDFVPHPPAPLRALQTETSPFILGHGKNKAVERDISIPEFISLTAQITNIDPWPLLWFLHNALNQAFLLFCLQTKNSFFNKKTQKCL